MLSPYGRVQLCDRSTPGSSVHGSLQARIPEWVARPASRGSSGHRDWSRVSCIAGAFFTVWAIAEAHTGGVWSPSARGLMSGGERPGAQQEGNRGSSPASWKTPASQTAGAGPVCNLDLLGCAPLAGRSVLGRGAPWRGWLPGTQRASSGSDRLSHPLPLPRHTFTSGSKGTLSHVLRLA